MKTNDSDETVRIEEFLGRPRLLRGEDKKNYSTLLKEVRKLLQPNDLFGQLEAREMANNIWETARFQQLAGEVVDAENSNAITKLADPKLGYVSAANAKHFKANSLPAAGVDMALLLNQLDISPELVRAKSVLLAAENVSIFEGLISTRIATRKAMVKTHDRSKRLAAKAERQAAKEQRLAEKHKRRVEDNDWLVPNWQRKNR